MPQPASVSTFTPNSLAAIQCGGFRASHTQPCHSLGWYKTPKVKHGAFMLLLDVTFSEDVLGNPTATVLLRQF